MKNKWSALQAAFVAYWSFSEKEHTEKNPQIPHSIPLQAQLFSFLQDYDARLFHVPNDKQRDSIRAIIRICERHNLTVTKQKVLTKGLYELGITKAILFGVNASEKKGEAALSLVHLVKSLDQLVNFASGSKPTAAGVGADREAMRLFRRRHEYLGRKRLCYWNLLERLEGNTKAAREKLSDKKKRARGELLAIAVTPEYASHSVDGIARVYSQFESSDPVWMFFGVAEFLLKQAKAEIALHKVYKTHRLPSTKGKPVMPENQKRMTIDMIALLNKLVGKAPRPSRKAESGKQRGGVLSTGVSILFVEDCRTALGFPALKRETIVNHGWATKRTDTMKI